MTRRSGFVHREFGGLVHRSEPLAVSRRSMAGHDLPKAKTPHEQESLQRQIATTDTQIDALVYELYRLTEGEIRSVKERQK